MKRRIAVFTGSRAEYGLLQGLMRSIRASSRLELQVIVSGMHLSPEFGETWREVEADGFAIDAKVEMLLSSNTAVGVVKSMGLGTIGCADVLDRLKPDAVVVLGDRFESLAVAQAALVMRIPVAHLHGGELTEGAYDDAIRHAITKMSSLHFTAAEPYRRRVIQMGEVPETVFNVGAIGLDRLLDEVPASLEEAAAELGFPLRPPFVLATYHPVTLADEDPEDTVRAMLQAIDAYPGHQVVLTYPNADNGGRGIIPLLQEYARARTGRVLLVPSLGFRRYQALLRQASAVVGNSSSGIIEAPSFGVPTVNIGARQAGRLAAASVLHCPAEAGAIRAALEQALSPGFASFCKTVSNPYGQGHVAERIVAILETGQGSSRKKFLDLDAP